MASFLYEGVLLFGVVMLVGLIYGTLTQQRHALKGHVGLSVTLFVVLGLYFVGLWSRSGQTLAMQTWHVRLVTQAGGPVPPLRAICRYLLAWLWFLPALITLWIFGVPSAALAFGAIAAGVLAYAALTWLHPDRQYWHDAVCGTRIVDWRPASRNPKAEP